MTPSDLAYMPATDMAAAIRARAISPVEIIDALFARIARINPRINAYCTLTEDAAREQARAAEAAVMRGDPLGPLHGVPVSIKDLLLTRGVPTMRGSRIYANTVPDEDAPAVIKLREAGAICVGKTTTPEFGWKGQTDSPATGITRNPWNLSRTPGGSSGGASAQVAAGLGPLAVGTDGAGSIRIPASLAGIFGLKPSFARVPVYPPSAVGVLSHHGPMTRTVRDAALMFTAMCGLDPRDPYSHPHDGSDFLAGCEGGVRGLRVAWSPTLGYAPVQPGVRALCEQAARVFASDLGCVVEEADPGFADPGHDLSVLWASGLAAALRGYLPEWEARMDPGLVEVVRYAGQFSAADHAAALAARAVLFEHSRRFFERCDLLITPTMPATAWPVDGPVPFEPDGRPSAHLRYTPFTYPFNMTGQPAASVPCGFAADGLPVGLQIVGRRLEDGLVLRAAAAFEAARPWAQHRPPVG